VSDAAVRAVVRWSAPYRAGGLLPSRRTSRWTAPSSSWATGSTRRPTRPASPRTWTRCRS